MGIWAQAIERLTLEPIFGQRAWTPRSTCENVHPRGPMPKGTNCCCMACHRTGRERHPLLAIDAEDRLKIQKWNPPEGGDPWSENDRAKATRYQKPADPKAKKTRTQKRAEKYGHNNSVTAVPMDHDEIASAVDSGHAKLVG